MPVTACDRLSPLASAAQSSPALSLSVKCTSPRRAHIDCYEAGWIVSEKNVNGFSSLRPADATKVRGLCKAAKSRQALPADQDSDSGAAQGSGAGARTEAKSARETLVDIAGLRALVRRRPRSDLRADPASGLEDSCHVLDERAGQGQAAGKATDDLGADGGKRGRADGRLWEVVLLPRLTAAPSANAGPAGEESGAALTLQLLEPDLPLSATWYLFRKRTRACSPDIPSAGGAAGEAAAARGTTPSSLHAAPVSCRLGQYHSMDAAKAAFAGLFEAATGHAWGGPLPYPAQPGKPYVAVVAGALSDASPALARSPSASLSSSYSSSSSSPAAGSSVSADREGGDAKADEEAKAPECKRHPDVQRLMEELLDPALEERTLRGLGIDVARLPTGELGTARLHLARKALFEASVAIENAVYASEPGATARLTAQALADAKERLRARRAAGIAQVPGNRKRDGGTDDKDDDDDSDDSAGDSADGGDDDDDFDDSDDNSDASSNADSDSDEADAGSSEAATQAAAADLSTDEESEPDRYDEEFAQDDGCGSDGEPRYEKIDNPSRPLKGAHFDRWMDERGDNFDNRVQQDNFWRRLHWEKVRTAFLETLPKQLAVERDVVVDVDLLPSAHWKALQKANREFYASLPHVGVNAAALAESMAQQPWVIRSTAQIRAKDEMLRQLELLRVGQCLRFEIQERENGSTQEVTQTDREAKVDEPNARATTQPARGHPTERGFGVLNGHLGNDLTPVPSSSVIPIWISVQLANSYAATPDGHCALDLVRVFQFSKVAAIQAAGSFSDSIVQAPELELAMLDKQDKRSRHRAAADVSAAAAAAEPAASPSNTDSTPANCNLVPPTSSIVDGASSSAAAAAAAVPSTSSLSPASSSTAAVLDVATPDSSPCLAPAAAAMAASATAIAARTAAASAADTAAAIRAAAKLIRAIAASKRATPAAKAAAKAAKAAVAAADDTAAATAAASAAAKSASSAAFAAAGIDEPTEPGEEGGWEDDEDEDEDYEWEEDEDEDDGDYDDEFTVFTNTLLYGQDMTPYASSIILRKPCIADSRFVFLWWPAPFASVAGLLAGSLRASDSLTPACALPFGPGLYFYDNPTVAASKAFGSDPGTDVFILLCAVRAVVLDFAIRQALLDCLHPIGISVALHTPSPPLPLFPPGRPRRPSARERAQVLRQAARGEELYPCRWSPCTRPRRGRIRRQHSLPEGISRPESRSS